jgi:hypothetical protein
MWLTTRGHCESKYVAGFIIKKNIFPPDIYKFSTANGKA